MRKGFLLSALLMPLLIAGTVRAGDTDKCEDLSCSDCPTNNFYAGFDLAVLKPHMGTLGAEFFGHPAVDLTPSFDYEASPRIWLGWDNAEGVGVRARYWTFESDATLAFPQDPAHGFFGPVLGTASWLNADTLDFEATMRGCLGQLEFQLAGGFRYATIETGVGVYGDFSQNQPTLGGIGMDFEGIGPTIAANVVRPIGSRGLALVGSARSSWMYGTTDVFPVGELQGVLPVAAYVDDHMMQINEVSLGVQWSRCLARGGQISVAAVWEAQAWEWAPVVGLIHQDIGLSGPTFSFTYMR